MAAATGLDGGLLVCGDCGLVLSERGVIEDARVQVQDPLSDGAEERLRFQENLLPLIETRMDAATGTEGAKARAVIATAFACLDAASMTWVANDGNGEIMDLYDECMAAVRG
ncbi:hypothetical protein [Streptomyces sp. NPDC007856]|uniref:hypothetical protein n=1 Tax=Streptomyces sp. NPDC007856 TaxID=3364781 RepID=UPI0036823B45